MPKGTERVGKMLLGKSDPYRLIKDELFEKWKEEEFADLYAREGKPGDSPAILAVTSVFQFMGRLVDRQVTQAFRMQLDRKYIFYLSLEDSGLDFRVLSKFRNRLIEGEAENGSLRSWWRKFAL